jgi:hypothetical protein
MGSRALALFGMSSLAACSADAVDRGPSALTAEFLDGWAQKGFLLARSRLEFRFDNTAGTQPAVAHVHGVEWYGNTWTYYCVSPCPGIPVAAGEQLDHVLASGVSGGDAFDGFEPDCSKTTEGTTTRLTVHLELDGVVSTRDVEVAEYCLACEDDLSDCVSYPSDPPE